MHMKTYSVCTILIIVMLSCKARTDSDKSSKSDLKQSRLFEILTSQETGINFENKLATPFTMTILTYVNFNNGAGVAVAGAGWGHAIPEIVDYMTQNCDYFFKTVNEFGSCLIA